MIICPHNCDGCKGIGNWWGGPDIAGLLWHNPWEISMAAISPGPLAAILHLTLLD